ncbi:MAG TPA: DUF1127 domain-containing protein [Alphaproteobacteria bacterium]|jgi:uncharacterized protein YjiS (DUF1127 family)
MDVDRRNRGPRRLTPVGVARRLVAAVLRRWRRARYIAELRALDDRTLTDIGLHRSDIRGAVIAAESGGVARPPRR